MEFYCIRYHEKNRPLRVCEGLWTVVVADDSVSADIKLETETEDGGVGEDIPPSLPANMYHPRRALRNALTAWLPEFR